jgi:putative tryptophan/tyrosine transport system substrate-binding protein
MTTTRRELLALLARTAAVAWPGAVRAQQERVRRIGVLSAFSEEDPETKVRLSNFLTRLQSLHWRVGDNLLIEYRYAVGDGDRIASSAREIVALAPEAIMTMSNPVLAALIRETRAIPIVFAQVADPVGSGFVSSLARPGGNVTGFANLEPPIGGKWVELLKEAAPATTRMLALHHPQIAANVSFLRAAEAAGRNLGVTIVSAGVTNPAEIERSVNAFTTEPNGGVIAMPNPVVNGARSLIIEFALKHRMPTLGAFRYMAASGTLLSYGNEGNDLFTHTADYIDRILRGAHPGDLPVQAPTKFELTINLKTARALGLTVPPALLVRADEVIE